MGRYYYSKKEEADSLKSISIYFLNQNKYFETNSYPKVINWSCNGEKTASIATEYKIDDYNDYLRFIYVQMNKSTGEKKDFDYKVNLTTTPCYYGGLRHW